MKIYLLMEKVETTPDGRPPWVANPGGALSAWTTRTAAEQEIERLAHRTIFGHFIVEMELKT